MGLLSLNLKTTYVLSDITISVGAELLWNRSEEEYVKNHCKGFDWTVRERQRQGQGIHLDSWIEGEVSGFQLV